MNRRPKKPTFPAERNRPDPKTPLSGLRLPCKSLLCTLFQRGKCNYGQNCRFAHSAGEVRFRSPAFTEELAGEGGKRYSSDNNPMFKSNEHCAYYSKGMNCPFGERCRFQHKSRALRKTRLCRQWERFGACPYGARCVFAHGNAELQELGKHPSLNDNAAESSDEDSNKISKKLRLNDRSYFTNWDVAKISRIYADN